MFSLIFLSVSSVETRIGFLCECQRRSRSRVGMSVYGRARGVHAREHVPWNRDNVLGSLWIPRMTS